jgi:hypothetical protein
MNFSLCKLIELLSHMFGFLEQESQLSARKLRRGKVYLSGKQEEKGHEFHLQDWAA